MRREKIDPKNAQEQLRILFTNANIGGHNGLVILNMIREGGKDELVHVCRVNEDGYNYISLTDGNRWFDVRRGYGELAKQLSDFMQKTNLEVEFYQFENIYEFSHFLRNYVDKRKARRKECDD